MKNKWIAILLIAVLTILPGNSMLISTPKVEAQTASASMTTHSWQVSFTKTLKESKITEDNVYVTNSNDQKVTAAVKLGEDKKTIFVSDLAPGSYKLHVNKDAFVLGGPKTTSQVIAFTIIEKLEAVKSEKELQQYFKTLLANSQKEPGYEATAEIEKSEDKASADNSSTTNNQVEGVEEGDIVVVKDGFIYSVKDYGITVVDAKDPKNLKLATTIKLKESQYISKLALYDNLLIVIGDKYLEKVGTSMSTATLYNISNPKNPKLIREVGQEGYLQDIRITNDTLYLIGNMYPNYWMLREQKTMDLKPKTFDSVEGKEYKSLPLDKISILPNTMDGTYSLITALDLKNGAKSTANTKGYLGGSSGLYMSENALYLTTPIYDGYSVPAAGRVMDMIWMPRTTDTQIFKWNVDGTAMNFVGTTEVKGSVLNQYSMDEYEGNFRIVTTEGNAWDEQQISRNHLFILDKNLQQLGAVKNLAPGEKVYSARFMGEKAYVVTFKQVDPLFVIDVANPKKPTVLGELKIPGFSNYLHPLDDTHLIGIGYDTEQRYDEYSKRNFTVTTNMKMSLFDVSDFKNPKEQSTVKIGGKGSYSEVQYNPKALFRNKEYNYFGFPVVLYGAGKGDEVVYKGQGAQIYEITANKGIVLKGNIVNKSTGDQYENWEQRVQRVVYIDDALYTIANNEVKSYQLKDFKPLDTLSIK
ncbi:beta-propeller domain-containing protein [Lysinibacillus xylanilyticus]|uniref:Beta-propeller domain-containing protein n=1 Tax=Lysinibacillus xylanilyticus TaxID=582475 RepID=A0ABT4EQK7_9BACI|nr:beta-propeller domain-containing protein [Lysinibacillus xylanilyticus]MCY9547963.1 beta-propeller domain-containing protein [Lysinibacillus xylanilyticus]